MKTVQIGSAVKVVDETGNERNGLVTNCWPPEGVEYDEAAQVHLAINIVFTSADVNKLDCYGRQTERLSSVMHRSMKGECPGRYWWQE